MPMADTVLLNDDLTNCPREPIHIPGAILPHGTMLVLDPETMQVQQMTQFATKHVMVQGVSVSG
jgi:light-regulated signal transduction histidine kinase (bacteriophytochrome)